ncbi:MAG TPA: hypothetical protein VNL36_07270 [Bacteroidota bacterium]|nr:hypothetical protein [Bacteroidota bacterium]
MQTARAHFDGKQILLDEPLNLKESDKLLVMVLDKNTDELSFSEFEQANLTDIVDDDFLSKEEINHYLSLR